MKIINKKFALWLFITVLVIVIDQVSKYWAVNHLVFNQPLVLLPFFNLTLNYNPGAAFSFLHNAGGWQIYLFTAISLMVSAVLVVWLARLKSTEIMKSLGLSLIIGGAIGNLIDRVRLSYVIDFFDFHIGNWHFATFNVADSAICVGAFFLILGLLLVGNTHRQ